MACDYWMPAFAGMTDYRSSKIFQIPLAEATMREPTFSLPSMNSTERVSRTTVAMRLDEIADLYAGDELHVHLDGGVRLVAGEAAAGHAPWPDRRSVISMPP